MTTPSHPARLLLVDDEPSIREPLGEYLIAQGFAVDLAANAAEARLMLAAGAYDLLVSDIMMPDEDGLSLTRFVRATSALPVILLTARAEDMEKIVGLEMGADDYLAKPFNPRELVARIRTVLRRAALAGQPVDADDRGYSFAGWHLRDNARALTAPDGAPVDLSTGEYLLLQALVRHPHQVMSRDRLLDMVRGREADIFDRAIDNLISRLRKKLEDDAAQPRLVKTVWGGGYTLACDVRRIGGAA